MPLIAQFYYRVCSDNQSWKIFFQYFSQFSSTTVPMTGSLTHIPQSEALLRPLSDIVHRRLSGSHNMRTDSDQGFSASLLYKGYLDDPRNTDNAWVETEVWNFHYDLGDEFDLRLKGVSVLQILWHFIFLREAIKFKILFTSLNFFWVW